MASVVVVDDDPIGREYVVTLLGYRGHRVIEAGDGTEALRAVREARPDLVIADVLMPAMDGLEFVRQLRAEAATASIPVVLYTAMHHQDEARALAKACGVAHVIAKPAEPETILSVVDAALAGAAAAAGDDTGWNQERATAATPHASLDAPSEPPAPPLISAAQLEDFSREHLQLLTNELAHKVRALEAMNERERAARAEAEAALRVRDEFLSIAAHELKTPLTTLLGFAQICLRQLDRHGTLDPDRARHAFEVVGAQARRLNRLVLRLLDVSRIQAGMLQLERADTDLTLLVEEVTRLAQVVAPKHELIIRAPREPVYAGVDALRFEQVVVNLVDNAIKYSPGGGAIEIALRCSRTGDVYLSVRDYGVGIPAEYRERVFERFFQANTGSKIGGMGLGLYVSRQIVAAHGGQIALEAPDGGGTRVSISLPAAPGVTLDGPRVAHGPLAEADEANMEMR